MVYGMVIYVTVVNGFITQLISGGHHLVHDFIDIIGYGGIAKL